MTEQIDAESCAECVLCMLKPFAWFHSWLDWPLFFSSRRHPTPGNIFELYRCALNICENSTHMRFIWISFLHGLIKCYYEHTSNRFFPDAAKANWGRNRNSIMVWWYVKHFIRLTPVNANGHSDSNIFSLCEMSESKKSWGARKRPDIFTARVVHHMPFMQMGIKTKIRNCTAVIRFFR